MSEVLLALEGLEVVYHRVVTAVQGISMTVPEGAIVALLGTNGAGKTTTLRAISGFIGLDDARVTAGAIRYRNTRIENRPPYRVTALGIALVPERSKVFENLTVAENLEAVVPRPGADRRRLGESVFELFPALARLRRREAGYLSGGERQMLAIGSALACAPELLLVDELSQGLAPLVVEELMRRLQAVREGLRHHRPAGGAERACRARDRRLRIRDGERPHRARRHARAARRAPGHPRVLSGRRRRAPQLSRRQAVPAEPAVVWLKAPR